MLVNDRFTQSRLIIMENYVEIAANYGFGGLIALGMGWFIVYLIKMHREERKELTQSLKEQHAEAREALDNNTNVLTEIRTIIQQKSR